LEEKLIVVVEDIFKLVHPVGLTIIPAFVDHEGFKEQGFSVNVETPVGETIKHESQLKRIRFRLVDGSHIYRVLLNFPTATKIAIPVGSKIFSSSKVLKNLQVTA